MAPKQVTPKQASPRDPFVSPFLAPTVDAASAALAAARLAQSDAYAAWKGAALADATDAARLAAATDALALADEHVRAAWRLLDGAQDAAAPAVNDEPSWLRAD